MREGSHIAGLAANAALRAHFKGTPAYTVGYEVEVLSSVAQDLGPHFTMPCQDAVRSRCDTIGYEMSPTGNALYELNPPPSKHPYAQYVMHTGSVASGLLPRSTEGVITMHASIGAPTIHDEDNLFPLAAILRVTEQLGGSVPKRMMAPATMARSYEAHTEVCSWDKKGVGGIVLAAMDSEYGIFGQTIWIGNNNRAEFRTLYNNGSRQLLRALEPLYYLSRAYIAKPGSALRQMYGNFDEFWREYCKTYKLPDLKTSEYYGNKQAHQRTMPEVFEAYLAPYAMRLKDKENASLVEKMQRILLAIREELGFSAVPSVFDPRDEAHFS